MGKKKSKVKQSQQSQTKKSGKQSNKNNSTTSNGNVANVVSSKHKRTQSQLLQKRLNSFIFFIAAFLPITMAVLAIKNFDLIVAYLPGLSPLLSNQNRNNKVDNNGVLNDDSILSSLHNNENHLATLETLLTNDNIINNTNNETGIHDQFYHFYSDLLTPSLNLNDKKKTKKISEISEISENRQIEYLEPPINVDNSTNNERILHDFGTNPHKLELWRIDSFFNDKVMNVLFDDLYLQYMNKSLRNKYYTFAVNKGNEKIRGNDNISEKLKYINNVHNQGYFSYCKWEYSKNEIIYNTLLNWLNHTYTMNYLSNIVGKKLIGLTDMFISAFGKNQFLSTHSDSRLGDIAFVLMISKNWDSDQFGGSLNFNCDAKNGQKTPYGTQTIEEISCYEVKYKFNRLSLFKVFPQTMQHFVKKVKIKEPRLAVTGWFMIEGSNAVHWPSVQIAGGAVYS